MPANNGRQNDSIIWSEGIKQMDLVIKDNSGGGGHAHKRADHEKFFPTKVRITMVQVSAGSTYDATQVALPGDSRLDSWKALPAVNLQADIHHVQGIDVENGILWVSSVDAQAKAGYVSRFDLASGKLLNQVQVQQGQRFRPLRPMRRVWARLFLSGKSPRNHLAGDAQQL